MSRKLKPVPQFDTEDEERAFWESHDSADHVDWRKAESVRLPNALLERIKIAASKRDVPYQSLIKMWLAEKVDASGKPR